MLLGAQVRNDDLHCAAQSLGPIVGRRDAVIVVVFPGTTTHRKSTPLKTRHQYQSRMAA